MLCLWKCNIFQSFIAINTFQVSKHVNHFSLVVIEAVVCRLLKWGREIYKKREENTQKHTLSVNKCWSQRAQKINRIMDYWHIYLTGFKRRLKAKGDGSCKKFYFVALLSSSALFLYRIESWKMTFQKASKNRSEKN